MTRYTDDFIHHGGGTFSAEASDLGIPPGADLPTTITLVNPKTQGTRTYEARLTLLTWKLTASGVGWQWWSPEGGTVTIYND